MIQQMEFTKLKLANQVQGPQQLGQQQGQVGSAKTDAANHDKSIFAKNGCEKSGKCDKADKGDEAKDGKKPEDKEDKMLQIIMALIQLLTSLIADKKADSPQAQEGQKVAEQAASPEEAQKDKGQNLVALLLQVIGKLLGVEKPEEGQQKTEDTAKADDNVKKLPEKEAKTAA